MKLRNVSNAELINLIFDCQKVTCETYAHRSLGHLLVVKKFENLR